MTNDEKISKILEEVSNETKKEIKLKNINLNFSIDNNYITEIISSFNNLREITLQNYFDVFHNVYISKNEENALKSIFGGDLNNMILLDSLSSIKNNDIISIAKRKDLLNFKFNTMKYQLKNIEDALNILFNELERKMFIYKIPLVVNFKIEKPFKDISKEAKKDYHDLSKNLTEEEKENYYKFKNNCNLNILTIYPKEVKYPIVLNFGAYYYVSKDFLKYWDIIKKIFN